MKCGSAAFTRTSGAATTTPGLSYVTLRWMLRKAIACGLPVTEANITDAAVHPEQRIKPNALSAAEKINWRNVGPTDWVHYTVAQHQVLPGEPCRAVPPTCYIETAELEKSRVSLPAALNASKCPRRSRCQQRTICHEDTKTRKHEDIAEHARNRRFSSCYAFFVNLFFVISWQEQPSSREANRATRQLATSRGGMAARVVRFAVVWFRAPCAARGTAV